MTIEFFTNALRLETQNSDEAYFGSSHDILAELKTRAIICRQYEEMVYQNFYGLTMIITIDFCGTIFVNGDKFTVPYYALKVADTYAQ